MKKKIISLLALVTLAVLGTISTTHANRGWDNDWDRDNRWNNNWHNNNWNNSWHYNDWNRWGRWDYPCWNNNNWYW